MLKDMLQQFGVKGEPPKKEVEKEKVVEKKHEPIVQNTPQQKTHDKSDTNVESKNIQNTEPIGKSQHISKEDEIVEPQKSNKNAKPETEIKETLLESHSKPEPEVHKPHIFQNQPQDMKLDKHFIPHDLGKDKSHENTHNNTHHKLENIGDFMDDSLTFKQAKQSVKDMFPTHYENEYDTENNSKFKYNEGDDREQTEYQHEEPELHFKQDEEPTKENIKTDHETVEKKQNEKLHDDLPIQDSHEQVEPEKIEQKAEAKHEKIEQKTEAKPEKHKIEKQVTNETEGSPNPKSKMNLKDLDPIGVKILVELTKFITSNQDSNIFEEYVFSQSIQVKGEQKEVFIINAQDFFETLEIYGIISNPINKAHKAQLETIKEELKSLLCLDKKYKDLLLLKKINRAINQVNQNEELFKIAKRAQYVEVHSDDDEINEESHNEQYDDEFIQNEPSNHEDMTPDKDDQSDHDDMSNHEDDEVHDDNLDDEVHDDNQDDDNYIEESFEKDQDNHEDQSYNKSPYENHMDEEDNQVYSEEFGPKSNEKLSSNALFGNVKDFSDLNNDDDYNASSNRDQSKGLDKKKKTQDEDEDDEIPMDIEDNYEF